MSLINKTETSNVNQHITDLYHLGFVPKMAFLLVDISNLTVRTYKPKCKNIKRKLLLASRNGVIDPNVMKTEDTFKVNRDHITFFCIKILKKNYICQFC